MLLDSAALLTFTEVVATGSFTQAGQRLGRTQSAISLQIAKMERHLGVQLLRRGKRVSLTDEGEVFLGYAHHILSLYRELEERFKAPDLEGSVRFGVPEDFAAVYLSDVLVKFAQHHPRVALSVECDLTMHLVDRFDKGEFDLVLVKLGSPQELAHRPHQGPAHHLAALQKPDDARGYERWQEVWAEKLEWVGNPHTLHHLNTADRREEQLPLVVSPSPCVYRARALAALERRWEGTKEESKAEPQTEGEEERRLERRPLSWRVVFSSPSYAGTVAAVKAGLGITVLPRTMIPPGLQALSDNRLPPLSDTHASLLRQAVSNPAVDSFAAFVMAKLQQQ